MEWVTVAQDRMESKINAELTQLIERKNAMHKKQKDEEELAKKRFIPLKPDQCHRVKKMARRLNFLDQRTKEVSRRTRPVAERALRASPLTVACSGGGRVDLHRTKPVCGHQTMGVPGGPVELDPSYSRGAEETGNVLSQAFTYCAEGDSEVDDEHQQHYNKWEEHKRGLENWVISEIITRPDLMERTLTLKKFIDVTRVCGHLLFLRGLGLTVHPPTVCIQERQLELRAHDRDGAHLTTCKAPRQDLERTCELTRRLDSCSLQHSLTSGDHGRRTCRVSQSPRLRSFALG